MPRSQSKQQVGSPALGRAGAIHGTVDVFDAADVADAVEAVDPGDAGDVAGVGSRRRWGWGGGRTARAVLVTIGLVCLAGCQSMTRSFPGVPADQVWTAAQAVAESPTYDDLPPDQRWEVAENQVQVFSGPPRMEIRRRLEGVRRAPGGDRFTQTRTWRHEVVLDPADPPQVRFSTRGPAIPMQAREEAVRFFAELEALLEPAS